MILGIGDGIEGYGKLVEFVLPTLIPDDIMMALLYNCLRVDIPDNNVKAEVVKNILAPLDFKEIGTGTNRIALSFNKLIFKVALDRRGLCDNFQEFKRSSEAPDILAKTYETNYLINVCEYVTLMNQEEFKNNERAVKAILKHLSQFYLFEDIGYTSKNSCNWGSRRVKLSELEQAIQKRTYSEQACILDYGYLYPLRGQQDKLYRCPFCSHKLKWNANYTGFVCSNMSCNFQCDPSDLRAKMDMTLEEYENSLMTSLTEYEMPDLNTIEQMVTEVKSNPAL